MSKHKHQGVVSNTAWTQPHMSSAERVKVVGRISYAELQARSPKRYKRKPKKQKDQGVPDYVMKNEVKRWAKHKGVDTQERGGYTIIKLN